MTLHEGETLGVVGESGCGKTTLSRTLVRLLDPDAGTLRFRGEDITHAGRRGLRPVRSEVQMVFQDPYASLNPRKRVGQIVGAPLRLHPPEATGARPERMVQRHPRARRAQPRARQPLPARVLRRPAPAHRRRARAGRQPRLIILDEPVSALDVSIQAQVINLLDDLQDELGLSYVFVAHDLSVVRHVSDRIAVMYLGKIMELSPGEELYAKPIHPYTAALLNAVPIPDPRENRSRERIVLEGEPPNPIDPPTRLRLPHALPARDRDLPHGRAAADRVRQRPPRRLPSPAERQRRRDRRGHALGRQPARRRRPDARAGPGRRLSAGAPAW